MYENIDHAYCTLGHRSTAIRCSAHARFVCKSLDIDTSRKQNAGTKDSEILASLHSDCRSDNSETYCGILRDGLKFEIDVASFSGFVDWFDALSTREEVFRTYQDRGGQAQSLVVIVAREN